MSNLSFKTFAQAKGFSLPVSTLAVAKSLNISPPPPPISMRAMIATAAPLTPVGLTYNASGGAVEFSWYDQANLPPWFNNYPAPNPLRQATSFEFKLWFWPTPNSSILIADVMLPGGNDPNSLPFGYGAGVLDGTYTFQIIAINAFGSTPTAVQTANIPAPVAAPNISVGGAANMFQIHGTGFEPWNGQDVLVSADAGATYSFSVSTSVTVNNGTFTAPLNTTGVCGQAGPGGALRFYVSLPNAPLSIISNIITGLACS